MRRKRRLRSSRRALLCGFWLAQPELQDTAETAGVEVEPHRGSGVAAENAGDHGGAETLARRRPHRRPLAFGPAHANQTGVIDGPRNPQLARWHRERAVFRGIVLSSCTVAATARASFGGSRMSGPLVRRRSEAANGASVRCTTPSRCAPTQLFSV